MTARGRDEPDGKRGQILAMMIISLLALCAVVAVAADVGFFFDYRRRMQTAADAAAMAGAHHVRRERLLGRAPNLTDVQNEGYKATASNGFTARTVRKSPSIGRPSVAATRMMASWRPSSPSPAPRYSWPSSASRARR